MFNFVLESAVGRGAQAKDLGEGVCVCCSLWWVSRFWAACIFWKSLGAGAHVRGLGQGCVRVLVHVVGAWFGMVSKCFVLGRVSVFGTSLEAGARERGLGRGCVHVRLLAAGV